MNNGEVKAPLFSILHTSARPDKWRAVYDDWMQKAVHPEDVEYVLCIDPRWGFPVDPSAWDGLPANIHVVLNKRRRCYVDGVNIAAEAATGQILIVNADDQFPCDKWDEALAASVEDSLKTPLPHGPFEFVIECDEGGNEHERGIMPMPILSRARYLKQGGFVFFSEYESVYADNDFFESAVLDGVVIDARHLLFPHRHPLYDKSIPSDHAYREQNRSEAYELGKRVYARRKVSGFSPLAKRRSIGFCYPGEHFEGPMVDALLYLQSHLQLNLDFDVIPIRSYTTNPYVTREDVRRLIARMETKPEMILWMDDDNPLSVVHFDKLLADLDAHPEVDGISGWCWIHSPEKSGFTVSCGNWGPDHLHWDPFPPSFIHRSKLEPFECGGFPCFLMRISALEKAGPDCFLPVLDNRLEHGMLGEDFAFFLAAEKGGAKFLVDPQVRVPHLKYVEVEPVVPEDGKASVKVACMIRAKNEARWIERTIDSVRELCGENIFLMEDGSIDNTAEIAARAGAVVLPSPFAGQGLDESRDKDWLLQHVIGVCKPDWILMPDGDEELQPGGCEKIRRALETNPDCDCLALRFLYFWDGVDQIRVDGVYGTMARQSLFRANSDFRFKSYYSEAQTPNQNHVGLHTSNAPGLGGRVMNINVALLHYGYLHREDRIRKYRWLVSIDPHNEGEDFYLHCVQGDELRPGDLPLVSADATLKHAGPLKLQKLPARMVPRFENGVPGPWSPEMARPGEVAGNGGGGLSPELAAAD